MDNITKVSLKSLAIFLAYFILVQSDLVEVDSISKVRPSGNKATSSNIYGAHSCGGKGQFIGMSSDNCNTTSSTCEAPANDQPYNNTLTLIPSQNVDQLAIKVIGSINGGEPMVTEDHPLENSKVVGGIRQIIHFTCRVPKENKRSMATVQVILYRVVDKIVETCGQADFILV